MGDGDTRGRRPGRDPSCCALDAAGQVRCGVKVDGCTSRRADVRAEQIEEGRSDQPRPCSVRGIHAAPAGGVDADVLAAGDTDARAAVHSPG